MLVDLGDVFVDLTYFSHWTSIIFISKINGPICHVSEAVVEWHHPLRWRQVLKVRCRQETDGGPSLHSIRA